MNDERTNKKDYELGDDWWWCKCDCGNRLRVSGNDLRSGRATSCGCDKPESQAMNFNLN